MKRIQTLINCPWKFNFLYEKRNFLTSLSARTWTIWILFEWMNAIILTNEKSEEIQFSQILRLSAIQSLFHGYFWMLVGSNFSAWNFSFEVFKVSNRSALRFCLFCMKLKWNWSLKTIPWFIRLRKRKWVVRKLVLRNTCPLRDRKPKKTFPLSPKPHTLR